eukprot:g355.t1
MELGAGRGWPRAWAAAAALVVAVVVHRLLFGKRGKSPPPPPGYTGFPVGLIPLLHNLRFLADPFVYLKTNRERHGPTYAAPLMMQTTIVSSSPRGNAEVLAGKATRNSNWPVTVRILLGSHAMSVVRGGDHGAKRRLMKQAVSQTALRTYVPAMRRIVREHLGRWAVQGRVVAFEQLKAMMFDTAAEILMGLRAGSATHLEPEFRAFIAAFLPSVFGFPRGLLAKRRIHAFLRSHVRRARAVGGGTHNVLHYLLEAGFATDEICEHMTHLLFASHETTTCTLTSLVMLLATHSNVLARVRAELAPAEQPPLSGPPPGPAASGTAPGVADADWERLGSLRYVHAVIQETLRLEPPVLLTFRALDAHATISGCAAAPGQQASVDIRGTHHDPALFPRPLRFDPDRFYAADPGKPGTPAKTAHAPYAFVPFGGGGRMCYGWQYAMLVCKVFVAEFASQFEWELVHGQDLRMIPSPTGSTR